MLYLSTTSALIFGMKYAKKLATGLHPDPPGVLTVFLKHLTGGGEVRDGWDHGEAKS
jgi:hypothetical protein